MIYTVTLNPAIDYVIKVDNFETGIVNRTKQENMFFGGKGINVSNVLNFRWKKYGVRIYRRIYWQSNQRGIRS